MNRVLATFLVTLVSVASSTAQTPPSTPPGTTPQPPKPVAPPAPPKLAPDAVVATVNGAPILERDVDAALDNVLKQYSRGMTMPPAAIENVRAQYRARVIEQLIDNKLLEMTVASAGVTVSDDLALAEMAKSLDLYLLQANQTRQAFAERVQQQENKSLEAFLAERAADADYRKGMQVAGLLTAKYPDRLVVTSEEISARYQRDEQRVYSKPERVRASHILIGADASASPEDKAAAKKKADEVLVMARADNADFAALAKTHSTGPSGPQGGDLGFFPRKGAMVEPFAAAAFTLQPGEVSAEIVETRFGYHIIRVTERETPSTISLDSARELIDFQLRNEKITAVRQEFLADLRKEAKITYPGQDVVSKEDPTKPVPAKPVPAKPVPAKADPAKKS